MRSNEPASAMTALSAIGVNVGNNEVTHTVSSGESVTRFNRFDYPSTVFECASGFCVAWRKAVNCLALSM